MHEAMRRLIAVPPIVAPARESEDAYVRRADGVVYICPWQTRLRSWLALGRLRATLPPSLTDTFVPRRIADGAAADFARWHSHAPSTSHSHPDFHLARPARLVRAVRPAGAVACAPGRSGE